MYDKRDVEKAENEMKTAITNYFSYIRYDKIKMEVNYNKDVNSLKIRVTPIIDLN